MQSQALRRDTRQVGVCGAGGYVGGAVNLDGGDTTASGGDDAVAAAANIVDADDTAVNVVSDDGCGPKDLQELSDGFDRGRRSSAGNNHDDVVFRASVVSEINMIKKEVSILGQELRDLRTSTCMSGKCSGASPGGKTRFIFVRFGCVCDELKFGKMNLEDASKQDP